MPLCRACAKLNSAVRTIPPCGCRSATDRNEHEPDQDWSCADQRIESGPARPLREVDQEPVHRFRLFQADRNAPSRRPRSASRVWRRRLWPVSPAGCGRRRKPMTIVGDADGRSGRQAGYRRVRECHTGRGLGVTFCGENPMMSSQSWACRSSSKVCGDRLGWAVMAAS